MFDLDGVLLNSRTQVRDAYLHAGVTMPEEAWGLSALEWLPQARPDWPRVHAEKNRIYLGRLERLEVPVTPMFAAMLRIAHEHKRQCLVLTGASQPVASTFIKAYCDGYPIQLLGHGATRLIRTVRLNGVTQSSCTYVDDREDAADIAVDAGCGFIHYDCETSEWDVDECYERLLSWT